MDPALLNRCDDEVLGVGCKQEQKSHRLCCVSYVKNKNGITLVNEGRPTLDEMVVR